MSETKTLVISVPSKPHEAMHLLLYREVEAGIRQMGLRHSWMPMDATTLDSHRRNNGSNGDSGEGDSSGGRYSERGGEADWPTLAIEAGKVQSYAALKIKMAWWFAQSNHDVKMVLLVSLNLRHQTIKIERWQEEPVSTRPGAATRNSSRLNPVCVQSITIRQDETTNPISYQVTRGDLVLPFELLFLRDPGPQEGDVVITVADLQALGRMVWRSL